MAFRKYSSIRKQNTKFIALALLILFLVSGCTTPNTRDEKETQNSAVVSSTPADGPTDIGKEASLMQNLQNAVIPLQQNDLTTGAFTFESETRDANDQIVYICSDMRYKYYIDGNDFHIRSALLNDEGFNEILSDEQALSENEFLKIGNSLLPILFPFMKTEYLEIKHALNYDDYANTYEYTIVERREDCIVNRGLFGLSKGGVLVSFSSTFNDFDDFRDSNKYSKEEVCDIVFKELLNVKEIVEASEGYAPDEKYNIVGLPPREGGMTIGDVDDNSKKEQLPPFVMDLSAQDDVYFIMIHKERQGDTIYWIVNAQVKTSWGAVESLFDYIWSFQIDANTGERTGYIQALNGG